MTKGKLILLVGIPGSGKSTVAKELGQVFSSDEVREKLFGDSSIQDHEELATEYLKNKGIDLTGLKPSRQRHLIHQASKELVFDKLHKEVATALKHGVTVVYDATNVSKKDRKKALKAFDGLYDSAEAVYVKTPLKVALERNNKRARKVDQKVIKRMYRNLEEPSKEEGFNQVIVINNE